MIFSGSSNKELAESVARYLNLAVSSLEITVFPDGERRIRVIDDVLEKDTFVIQPTATPGDQNYMELFLIVDALRRSGARSVTGIVPYLGYQRQDHVFRSGEAVSLEVISETLERVGLSKIVCLDLHSVKIPEVFSIPVLHLSALPLFAQKIREIMETLEGKTILVTPDMGGIRRIKQLSEMLDNMPYAIIEKDRDLETGSIRDASIDREVKDRTAFIVDDMISTGKTIIAAAKLLKENGVNKIYVFATHGVLSKEAPEILESELIEKVYLTDSVYVPEEKKFPKLEIISIADTIANAISS